MHGERERQKQTNKRIAFGRDKVFSRRSAALDGQRGVCPAPVSNSELTQTVVRQIKSEIYGG